MRRERKRNKIIVITLGIILCLMGVGYAAFQTNLDIKGTSSIDSKWDIRITNVTESNKYGSAESAKTPSWTDLTANMEANLYSKGDYIEYEVTIENKGTFDAKLDDVITNIKSNNEAVLITFSGYTKGQPLYKNSKQIITVKIEYNPDYEGDASGTSGEVSVDFEYTQNEGGTIEPTKDYLVTYDCTTNGGTSCNGYNEYLPTGSNINLSYSSEKAGYDFVGWNTDRNAKEGLKNLTIANDTILYAIYKKDIKITYEKGSNVSNIGKTSDTCTMYNNEGGCSITLPSIAPNAGYTSVGWSTINNDTTGIETGETTMISEDSIYYANAIDNIAPTITLSPDTLEEYAKTVNVTVTLGDEGSGLKAKQNIYYAWSTSKTTEPTYYSYVTTSNEEGEKETKVTISASGLTGTYYLWIKAGTLSDVSTNVNAKVISNSFKFDNTKPTGSITFTGNMGTVSSTKSVYLYGSSVGSAPYSSSSTSDANSGVGSSSLKCTSSNTAVATVSNASTSKVNITIKSRKGTANSYHYLQEYSTINCTLTITDKAGNTNTITKSAKAGNGWFQTKTVDCTNSNGTEYNKWNYINAMKKVTGWVYTYWYQEDVTIYYYFNSSGIMLRGWQKISGSWFYFADPCTTEYKTSSGWDYPNGGMLWSDSLIRKSDGERWEFDKNGYCISGSGC